MSKRGSIRFIEGMLGSWQPNYPDGDRMFDWDKAARLIKEHNIQRASAGLAEDWDYTSGMIYAEKPVMDSYTYLGSRWATPILVDELTQEEYDCWMLESESEWDVDTKWPESALAIINES